MNHLIIAHGKLDRFVLKREMLL